MPCLIDVASEDGKLFGDDGIDVEDEVVFKNADYTDLSAWQGMGECGTQCRFISGGFDDQIKLGIISKLCRRFHTKSLRDRKPCRGSSQDRRIF